MFKYFKNESGIALIMVMILLVLVGGLTAALLTAGIFNIGFGADEVDRARAFYAADAGIEHIRSLYNDQYMFSDYMFSDAVDWKSEAGTIYENNFEENDEVIRKELVYSDNSMAHYYVEFEKDDVKDKIIFTSHGEFADSKETIRIELIPTSLFNPEGPWNFPLDDECPFDKGDVIEVDDGYYEALQGQDEDVCRDELDIETTNEHWKYLGDTADALLHKIKDPSPEHEVEDEFVDEYFGFEEDWPSYSDFDFDKELEEGQDVEENTIEEIDILFKHEVYEMSINKVKDSVLVFEGDLDIVGFSAFEAINSVFIIEGDLKISGSPEGTLKQTAFYIGGDITDLQGNPKWENVENSEDWDYEPNTRIVLRNWRTN